MKLQGWELRLEEELEKARLSEFKWGSNDCACWSFSALSKLSDKPDLSHLWRGKYNTAQGSVRIMRSLGWKSYLDMGTKLLGSPLPSVKLAQRGDLILDESTIAFGLCLGQVACFLAPVGLTYRPSISCSVAWRV